jgi:prepilin-type N-terminal cleavage/methylation domain-containing protein/prepilin-type processing-associated H-X9-DG protein
VRPASQRAFTLVELLVVVAVIAVLLAILVPTLEYATSEAKKSSCLANLRQIGSGISLYAAENDGCIPYGPKAPAFTSPADLYPSTGSPTSLLSLRDGRPCALGLILKYLQKPEVLFCPGSDQPEDARAELAKVGKTQAQGSYFYRHAGNTRLFDSPTQAPPRIRLAALGENRNRIPIRALVMDTAFQCPPDLEQFNVMARSYHKGRFSNVLYSDGRVASLSNADSRFTVNVNVYSQLRSSFDKILAAFEKADEL